MISLRFRLTLWYSLVLAIGLALFGGGVWLALRQAMYATIGSTEKQYVEGLVKVLKTEIAESIPRAQLREELAEYANAIPDGYWIQVREASGAPLLAGSPPPGVVQHPKAFSESVVIDQTRFDVSALASLDNVNAVLKRLLWMMLLAVPVTLLLAGFGGYLLSRRALSPVDDVTAAARSITLQNLSQRLSVPRTGDELQRLSEAWNETLARLDVAVKRLTQFTADASHELRSPIAVMRTTAEVALRKERTPKEYRDALRQVSEEAERTSQLVEDLLTLARADAGLHAWPVTQVNLTALVEEEVEHADVLASAHGLSVNSNFPSAPVLLDGNEAGLRRLLSVLVDNALRYTPPGGSVNLVARQDSDSVRIEVRDTGVGIAPEVIPHIFERFYRADESRSRDAGGSGLGLSIAKWIADRHDAKITVESAPGRGSTFIVLFPKRRA